MFKQYNLYMMKLIGWPTLLITITLTSIIWLTQALRYIDFIVNRGLSIVDFLHLAVLLIPTLLMLILPVAFFVGTLFAYNKLATESELVVLKASGLSAWQLARPALIIGLLMTLIAYALSLYVMPLSKRQFKDTQDLLKHNYSSVLLQEEVFSNPVDGLTVFVRERDDKGNLKGILVHDNRIAAKASTMMAEEGKLVQTAAGPRFYLVKGLRQVLRNGKVSWLNFDSYSLDISFYTAKKAKRRNSPEELKIHELFAVAKTLDPKIAAKYIAQAHQRLTLPIISLTLGLLAAMTLVRGEFNRRGHTKVIAKVSVMGIGLIMVFFGMANMIAKHSSAIPAIYVLVGGVLSWVVFMLLKDPSLEPRGEVTVSSN